jgi:polyhydroxyalkanoate synthesis regulator phasin
MLADKISAILQSNNNQNKLSYNENNRILDGLIRKTSNNSSQDDNQTILDKLSEILKNSNAKKKTENSNYKNL